MIKKPLALILAVLLAAICFAGCDASAGTDETASASAGGAGATPDLDTEREIEGLKYKVSSEWTETDAGTMAAYGGELSDDLVFSITVAALDAELVEAAESSGTEPNGALLSALGVDSSGIEEAEFKGRTASAFSGEAENAYQATGYTVLGSDGTMYILLMLSDNIENPGIQQLWSSFLDAVELPE